MITEGDSCNSHWLLRCIDLNALSKVVRLSATVITEPDCRVIVTGSDAWAGVATGLPSTKSGGRETELNAEACKRAIEEDCFFS
jgi:hypothetical protein